MTMKRKYLSDKMEWISLNYPSLTLFVSKKAMKQLLFRLRFSQSSIKCLIDHKGLTSAQELTIIRPNDLSDSLESVNRLFGNSSRPYARIYFPP